MLKIIPLNHEHLEAAAALVSSRYQALRTQHPLLPVQYQHPQNFRPMLQNIMDAGCPGVAALQDGQLVGFMTGWLMPDFRGKRSVYSPEWANAAQEINCRYIYERMYQSLADHWVAEKYIAHYLSIFADDQQAIQACHWLGFGLLGVDALRGLEPVEGASSQIEVRLANLQDLDQVMELHEGMVQFARSSPYFFIGNHLDKTDYIAWIQQTDRVIWLALVNQDPVAFLRIGPANDDVAAIIVDQKTTSIYEAFTQEKMRGKAIGRTILAHALEDAHATGYQRCAVDFESMNFIGTRFWFGQGFKPVCYSLLRMIDERVL
jgi:GNAT superfamily N-acetyltransferase